MVSDYLTNDTSVLDNPGIVHHDIDAAVPRFFNVVESGLQVLLVTYIATH